MHFCRALPCLQENVHRIVGEEGADKAARAYESVLRNFLQDSPLPVFDLVLLGTGEDGHTASLFPGSAALREQKRWAVPVFGGLPRLNRVTLTLPVLNNASQVLFLVRDGGKRGLFMRSWKTTIPRTTRPE